MPSSGELSRLQALIAELGIRLGRLTGDRAETLSALKVVFAVNNELGRLARTKNLTRDPAWTALQLQLNAVTRGLKRGNVAEARSAHAEVEGLLARLTGGARERTLRKNL